VFSEKLRICMSSSIRWRRTVMDKLLVRLKSLHVQQLRLCKGGEMDQKDEKPGQHQLLGGSDVPTTAKRFSTKPLTHCSALLVGCNNGRPATPEERAEYAREVA
jgi:hypothetical protein